MMRFARPGVKIAIVTAVAATALAACAKSTPTAPVSYGPGGSFGTVPGASTTSAHPGTITIAEPPSTAPTWILPVVTSAANSVFNDYSFDYLMWRPLYWFYNGVNPVQTPAMSLANDPVWTNGDKTATLTLKSGYKWSNGDPLTSKDVLFWYDLMVAAVKEDPANWAGYTPGLGMPDQVKSVTAPNSKTVVFTMKTAVNPTWFWQDYIASIQPMPSAVWSKDSATGPIINFTVPANATKIYNYLSKQSTSVTTYATNPLWKVIDGPYTLTSFNNTTGAYTMSPNPSYGGPHATAAKVSKISLVPFTSDTAEFDAVKSGSVDVGYEPQTDVAQTKSVEASGYVVYGYPDFGFNYIAYNFADTTGSFNKIIGQLYVRQAIAHLEDEAGYIKAFFGGAGSPGYGTIPVYPRSPYTPVDATSDPYPYSISSAISLLKSHGWTINTSGTDTCAKPGTASDECGAGIAKGTPLSFNLIYSTSPAIIGLQCTALASAAAKAGITMHLTTSNFDYMITNYNNPAPTGKPNIDKWAMEDFGGFSISTYPTTNGIFNYPSGDNIGSYSNAEANKLITASVTSPSVDAVKAESSYLTKVQPGLFEPNVDLIEVWKKDLSGPPSSFASLTQYQLTPEYWYFIK
jgi:peptide/nickel transport system substrate-binding protein